MAQELNLDQLSDASSRRETPTAKESYGTKTQ